MSLDTKDSYSQVRDKIQSAQTYKDSKEKFDDLQKKAGDSFEQQKSNLTQSLNSAKENVKSFQNNVKSQFDQLLNLSTLMGGSGASTIAYVKRLMIKTIRTIEPEIAKILAEEALKAAGCDHEQAFQGQILYIKVASTDVMGLLKIDPTSDVGRVYYERNPVIVQDYPFSFNKELWNRIQSPNPYSTDNGQLYIGASGNILFDIQYVQFDNNNISGPWWKVTLPTTPSPTKMGKFIIDYYKTIRVVDFKHIIACIMDALCGAVSVKAGLGFGDVEEQTKFDKILQRVLGLCFDNAKEIDVSGISKIDAYDGIDDTFFEFNEIELRDIQQTVTNIKNRVLEFEDCDNIKVPIETESIMNSLTNLLTLKGKDEEDAAFDIVGSILDNPDAKLGLNFNFKASLDLSFVKKILQGIMKALLTPKIILPIYIVIKSLGKTFIDSINSITDFIKAFKKYFTEIASRIWAIFIKKLFEYVKKQVFQLLQSIINDIARETQDKKIIIILKLIQIINIIYRYIRDYRRCKSLVDEILDFFTVLTTGWGGPGGSGGSGGNNIPTSLLFASQALPGASPTRAFMNQISELQKMGVPTGPMEDGSPNLFVLSKLADLKGSMKEQFENGKSQIAVPPLAMTPAGFTLPISAYGKST